MQENKETDLFKLYFKATFQIYKYACLLMVL